nr:protein translocase subunit SecF [Gammaproteobacteria bacterium]
MDLFRRQTNIDFIGRRRLAYMLSLLLLILSFVSLATRGLNLGIDFTGGTLVEIAYPQPVETINIQGILAKADFEGAIIQHYGSSHDVLVRIPPQPTGNKADLEQKVMATLRESGESSPELRRVEYVGPQVGKELVEDGGLAILLALGAIVVYIWLRFERRFALGALAATLHDPIVTLGYFSLFGTEFDMPTLAAILAVIGYSVNDTIVVFDRIRDNSRKMRKATPIGVVNTSINQTLSRTINTSGTTLLVIIALFVFGGPLLNGFSLALLIGIIVGTYSSVYVASAAALDLGLSRADLLTVDKDSVEHDHRP